MDTEVDFATFVRAHTPALFRSAYLMTRSSTSAEDLVQDTFARLYPKWSRVAGAQVPLAYVHRAMVNNYLNSQRSARGHELLLADPPDRAGSPDPALLVTEQDLVRRLLDRLPARSRAVLVLRFFRDLSDAEIAAELGCRQGTVRSIVNRALATLREETDRGVADPTARVNGINS